jgi:hypothetical protein
LSATEKSATFLEELKIDQREIGYHPNLQLQQNQAVLEEDAQ